MQLHTAGLLIIRERKLLFAFSNNKQCYYLPGGKIDAGETATEALRREILEELNIRLKESDLKFFTHITAPAYGEKEGVVMEQDCFLVSEYSNPVASSEIGSLHYFTLADYLAQPNTAPGAVLILQKLKSAGLVE